MAVLFLLCELSIGQLFVFDKKITSMRNRLLNIVNG